MASFDPLADFDAEIVRFLEQQGVPAERIELRPPPRPGMGERASNAPFLLARERRQPPNQIAAEIAASFQPVFRFIQSVDAAAGHLNFRLNYDTFVPFLIKGIRAAGMSYGEAAAGEHVVVEHTSVNPNKEWHIGHVRNAVLGDVIARVLRRIGHEVEVQNYIDDTGLQAAQAIVALRDFPEAEQPREKFDHYVGRLYTKVASELAAEPRLKQRLGEAGGDELQSVEARLENIKRLQAQLVATMHQLELGEYHPVQTRILDAQLETAYRLGIYYDLLNWESNLVESGTFAEAMTRLDESPAVARPEEGRYAGATVIYPSGEPGPDEKAEVLIRSSGLPTYVAKDIAYHLWKFHRLPDRLRYVQYKLQPNDHELWSTALHGEEGRRPPPDRVINIIGVHQSAAQQTVKDALVATGFPEAADKLVHLAYGLVSTSEGQLSGRKGTAISGDAVIDEAVRVAHERVREKGEELTEEEMRQIAEAVGVGAVRYFMVQYNPTRDIVFDVADVVSYDGNTALYIQYALVRMFAILRKAAESGIRPEEIEQANVELLGHQQERRLIMHLAGWPAALETAARTMAVNLVAEYAYELAGIFSQFYRDCGVLNAEAELRKARLLLIETVRDVLGNAADVLGIPVIDRL
ncbi:MAG: arginine--tRNA ligase [Chloroflexota bacterium]